jgi:hypothetical protein
MFNLMLPLNLGQHQPPTGTAEAMAVMMNHEMKKGKNPDFIYYNEK